MVKMQPAGRTAAVSIIAEVPIAANSENVDDVAPLNVKKTQTSSPMPAHDRPKTRLSMGSSAGADTFPANVGRGVVTCFSVSSQISKGSGGRWRPSLSKQAPYRRHSLASAAPAALCRPGAAIVERSSTGRQRVGSMVCFRPDQMLRQSYGHLLMRCGASAALAERRCSQIVGGFGSPAARETQRKPVLAGGCSLWSLSGSSPTSCSPVSDLHLEINVIRGTDV